MIWLTGLPSSGKTTPSRGFLKARGVQAGCLDGDTIPELLPQTGLGRPGRGMRVRRIGHLASTLERDGIFVVFSLIAALSVDEVDLIIGRLRALPGRRGGSVETEMGRMERLRSRSTHIGGCGMVLAGCGPEAGA